MTSDLVRRLREYQPRGTRLTDGIWAAMLEASDRLEAYEVGIAAIQTEMIDLEAEARSLREENLADNRDIDRMSDEISRLRTRIRVRQDIYRKIVLTQEGLGRALTELGAALPLSTRDDSSAAGAAYDPLSRLVDTEAEAETLSDILSRPPSLHIHPEPPDGEQNPPAATEAATQPDRAGGASAASARGAESEPVPAPATPPEANL